MRDLSPALASHLAGGVTTLCRCWRLTRRDGVVFGFTDHDRDVSFGGLTFSAASGLTASDAESQLGLAVSGGEVSGALTSAGLTEADIVAGRYDSAEIATFLVNWADVSQRLALDVATIGEIRRQDAHFVVELRNAAHRYDQTQGRLYQSACNADLGDARCTVSVATYSTFCTIAAVSSPLAFAVTPLSLRPAGWADGGRLVFHTGSNAGLTRTIRSHTANGALELWEPLGAVPQPGDTCTVYAGCDKAFSTCAAKFANSANFRGFPDIPTPDFVLNYARPGEGGHDGGALDP